jgi:hypothetical protein
MVKISKQVAKTSPAKEVATVTAPASAPATTETAKVKPQRYVKGRFPGNGVITLKVTGNPKRPSGASHARFNLHKNGITVAEYVQRSVEAGNKASLAHDDLRWDAQHGFIEVAIPASK